MAFKFKTQRKPTLPNLPSRPHLSSMDEPENLIGEVQERPASAPEERLARALDEAKIQYLFRYAVGAPRGLPGWKEVDFVVMTKGVVYTVEVDTAFTHRGKALSDVLHDAIVLNDFDLNAMGQVFPEVLHADGETELDSMENARQHVRRNFGK